MKIQVSKTINEDIEISLPYYYKSSAHHYCTLSEDKTIQVYTGFNQRHAGVNIISSRYAFDSSNVPCTKEEFEEALQNAMQVLSNISITPQPQQA